MTIFVKLAIQHVDFPVRKLHQNGQQEPRPSVGPQHQQELRRRRPVARGFRPLKSLVTLVVDENYKPFEHNVNPGFINHGLLN